MSEKLFATICFMIMMENLGDKHPSYVMEKLKMLDMGYDAFAKLDIYNMRKVMGYCAKWKLDVPRPIVERIEAEEEAMAALKLRGIEL